MIVKLNDNTLTLPESIMKKYNLKPGNELNIITNEKSIELKFN